MRIGLKGALVAGALVGVMATFSGWLGQTEAGLRQLMSGTILAGSAADPERTIAVADWHDPQGTTDASRVAMSESDWLKLADDLAPVSYLAEPPALPTPLPEPEQQPL